jgi:hypothetical protein
MNEKEKILILFIFPTYFIFIVESIAKLDLFRTVWTDPYLLRLFRKKYG